MNRQIKFRAWTGYKMEYNVMVGHLGAFYCAGLDPNDSASLSNTTIYGKETPIMQFTGLLGKNGKEIWEGDIVQFESDDKPYVVEWKYGRFIGSYRSNWDAKFGEMIEGAGNPDFYEYRITSKSETPFDGDFYEFIPVSIVIGNIHQNPELLSV